MLVFVVVLILLPVFVFDSKERYHFILVSVA